MGRKSSLCFSGGRAARAAAILALLQGLLAGQPALAFELFGIKFFEGKTEEAAEPIGDPQAYSVDFVVTGGDGDTEQALKRASNLWQDREEPASGAAGLLVKARGDYRRLLAALYGEGRYGGTISIRIDGREAADLAVDAEIPDPAGVTVEVDAGPLFRFGEAEIVNRAPPPQHEDDELESSPEEEGFLPGEPARSGVVLKAEKLAVEAWREQGHAKAEVAERRVVAAHPQDVLDATIVIEPGRRAAYGPVTVEGTGRMDPGFVAYMTDLPLGQEYDPDDIEKANERLARLDVFRSVRLEEAEEIGDDGLLPINVVLQERLPRRIGVGGSYSTIDGLGLEAFWLHRNLFGRAERLRLEGKVAGIGNTLDPKDFTYRVGATFTRPGVFTPDTDFIASVIGDREVLEPYTRTGVTGNVGFNRIFSDELSGRLFANGGYSKFDDDAFGEREFVTAGFLTALTYDTRDDPADATEGFFLEGTADPFYEFNHENFMARFTAEGRAYYGFGEENRLVLAGRLKLGVLTGPPVEEIPPDRLFFAGGGGSVRGYAYRNIGIDGPNDTTIGGRSLIEASAELRARVTETIGLVGFVDAGYVGEDTFPDFSEDLRVGVGVGLRYLTGFGPIRLDVAVPLDPGEGDPDAAFYVGIGQAF